MGQQQGQQGGRAVRPRERGELGDGVEGGGVGDQLGGEAVREQGEQQLVGGGASERLLQQTVRQVVHVARHAPPQHSLDLGGELAGRPPLPPSLNNQTFSQKFLCTHAMCHLYCHGFELGGFTPNTVGGHLICGNM